MQFFVLNSDRRNRPISPSDVTKKTDKYEIFNYNVIIRFHYHNYHYSKWIILHSIFGSRSTFIVLVRIPYVYHEERNRFLKRRKSILYRFFPEYPHSGHVTSYSAEVSLQQWLSWQYQEGSVIGHPQHRLPQRTFSRINGFETAICLFQKNEYWWILISNFH